jgi:tetratricopeptide (TPR) repeat protein
MKNRLSSPWLALILITVLAAIIYSNIYHCPFVFDDISSITESAKIRDLGNYFSLKQLLKPRAIVNLTLALNYRFGKLNVFGYHLVNVLIHIINGFFVYFLALTIFKRLANFPKSSNSLIPKSLNSSIGIMSLFAALIFIAHPIQTQAVTYTIQRYASVAAMFYMGSVLFYLKARIRQGSEVRGQGSEGRRTFSFQLSALYILSLLCGLLAFMSKQNTASLPGAIVLVECMCFGGTWRERARRFLWIIPVLVLFAAFVLYAMGLFSGAGIGSMLEDVSGLARETELVSRWSYLCTQFNVLVIYIRLLFLPIGQNLDYIYPFKTGFFDGLTFLAFTFLAGLAVLAVWKRKSYPVFTVALFWFFITLSVESSIIPIRDALFEHRLYLPMFGFAIVVSYIVFNVLSRKQSRAIIISAILIVSLGTATYLRNRVWQDHITIWSDVLSKTPQSIRGHNNLGNALSQQGRFDEAISHYSEVLRFAPDDAETHYNLGIVMGQQGDYQEAINYYSKALRSNPRYAKAHNNLGAALARQGSFKEAVSHYLEALRINPDHANAHHNLGNALARQGNFEEAIHHFSEALRINPDHAKAHHNLGAALVRQGNLEEAIGHFSKALRIEPDYAEAQYNLGAVLETQGSLKEAMQHYSEALRIKPDDAGLHHDLGVALARQGKLKEAIKHFSEALRIKPDDAKAHYNLGGALKQQGKLKEAIHHFSEALRIKPDYAKAHYNLGIILARQGNFEKAISHYSEVVRLKPDFSAAVYYNMACIDARQNKIEESIDWLKKAIKSGYKNWGLLKTDKDLENIRGSSYYKELIEGLKKMNIEGKDEETELKNLNY